MTPRKSRRVWALALALAATGWATRDARADAIPYGTIGWVDTPAGGDPRPGHLQRHHRHGHRARARLNLGPFESRRRPRRARPSTTRATRST